MIGWYVDILTINSGTQRSQGLFCVFLTNLARRITRPLSKTRHTGLSQCRHGMYDTHGSSTSLTNAAIFQQSLRCSWYDCNPKPQDKRCMRSSLLSCADLSAPFHATKPSQKSRNQYRCSSRGSTTVKRGPFQCAFVVLPLAERQSWWEE